MVTPIDQQSIQYVKGVGPAKLKLFANLGVHTVEDLLYLFPRRYEDRRNLTPIAQVQVGEYQTITGKIKLLGSKRSYYTKKHVQQITVDDGSGLITCVWFNQPYLKSYFKQGGKVICYGRIGMYKNRLQMVSPEYELIDDSEDESMNVSRIVPIYPLTRGISQRFLRKVIFQCIEKYTDQLSDELPVKLRNKLKLANIRRSIANIHFPDSFENQEEAIKRISFEEFYFFQISVILRRLTITQKIGVVHQVSDADALSYVNNFSFELTRAQKRVIQEIRKDMQKGCAMLRLLQGDVGSGKTLVALFGCYVAFKNHQQAAFMAPTEILARQHFENFQKFTDNGALKGMRICLLISGLKKAEREKTLLDIREGNVDVVIGTHALITDEIQFKKLSYVVIDEQHKFGVQQRALLTEKGGNPDVLIMTATPIPRTLYITLYGDLDVSVIDELPKGRGKVLTKHYEVERAKDAYAFVRQKIKEGRQSYIVYPMIEESEKVDLKAAQDMYQYFAHQEYPDLRVGLVHGRMKRKDMEETMASFKKGEIDVLVATTVLEVGVDVPNASVMLVEHAERFGLAQLHQLRGRIGRGIHDSYCFLISDPTTKEGEDRLAALLSTTDGFKIAQADLEIRGPGRYFGRHQHGLNELKVANPITQLDILELARKEAIALTDGDLGLKSEENKYVKKVILKRYPTYLDMITAG